MHTPIQRHLAAPALAALALLAGCGENSGQAPSAAQPSRLLAETTASFGVTDLGTHLQVDSGAGLVFKVLKFDGNVTSIKYKDSPELAFVSGGRASQISSGIPAVVSHTVSNGVIKITLTTATLIHYIMVKQNDNTMYMATYTSGHPPVGELRWITRLQGGPLPNRPVPSNTDGTVRSIESSDVYANADNTTRSKYYGNDRAMDLSVKGVSGPGVGIYMIYGNRETSSGGPFYRDIQFQAVEVYNYMNSGHAQTEPFRLGLHGPYALAFTDGPAPAIPDMSWVDSQGLQGWVGPQGRGSVASTIPGLAPAAPYTVGLANGAAQYWGKVKTDGSFEVAGVKPGTYTMTLYRDELEVLTREVSVAAGQKTEVPGLAVTADPAATPVLWRIGKWDGTPLEFKNGSKINFMHPSDPRMAPWDLTTYTVGSNTALDFPAAQAKNGLNSPTTVKFFLRASQIKNRTIRIGITAAGSGGRPGIQVNGWGSATPPISPQPTTRMVTVGNYRGRNTMFTYNVPASAFVAGTNTLVIHTASGSGGWHFLGPYFVYDAVDMLQ